MKNQWKMIDSDTVSWGPDWSEVGFEFDIDGKARCTVPGSVLPDWLAELLEANESERRHAVSQGDAWSGGFAENH